MVVVIRTFRLHDDAGVREFLNANESVQTGFSHLRAGFVRRTVARGDGGAWLVLEFWGSEEDAAAAERAERDDRASQAMWALIDPATIETKRFETLD
jgi:hypothetical protein